MTMFDTECTNIFGDSEVAGRSPDAEGDYYHIGDAQADHNYWQEKICDVIGAISDSPTTDFMILYGGVVTDAGSGKINISAGVVRTKDSDGNRRLAYIPAISNLSLPSGWNDGRNIWVKALYDSKLGTATRTHRVGTSYHYQLIDTYIGDPNGLVSTTTDDIFASADPVASATILGKFTMTGTTFADLSPSVRSTSFRTVDNNPVGTVLEYTGTFSNIPSDYMIADGSSLSRASYPALFAKYCQTQGTCTISNASPGVVTFNGHGRVTGDCISFTTDGALPTGLSVSTKYYVIYNDANSFWVATTLANALAGTKINTSSAGSGTHTLMYNPWGIADATHFNLPDFRGLVTVGAGQQGSADWASAEYKESFGQNRQDEFQAWQLGVTNNGGTHYSAGYNYNSLQNDTAGGSPGFTSIFNNTGFQGHAYPFIAYSDGTNGTPRKGKKTTPARAAVYKIIKVI